MNSLAVAWIFPKRSFCFILPFTYYSIASDLKMLPCQGSFMLVTVKISRSSEMKLKFKPCWGFFLSQSTHDKNFGLIHSETCQCFDHWILSERRASCSHNGTQHLKVKLPLPTMQLWAYNTLGMLEKEDSMNKFNPQAAIHHLQAEKTLLGVWFCSFFFF